MLKKIKNFELLYGTGCAYLKKISVGGLFLNYRWEANGVKRKGQLHLNDRYYFEWKPQEILSN